MLRPLSNDLRKRVVAYVEASNSCYEVATHREARRGEGRQGRAAFGHWGTQTFVAGLRCDDLIAPLSRRCADEPDHLRSLCRHPVGACAAAR